MNRDSVLLKKSGFPLGKVLQDLSICAVYELWEGTGIIVDIKL